MTHNSDCCHNEQHEHHEHHEHTEPEPGGVRAYWPLIVVVVIAVLMAVTRLHPMTGFMGYFLILLSMFKFFDLNAFADGFGMYDVIAKRFRAYAYVYPFIELLLGLGFLSGVWPFGVNLLTVAVMSISSIGVTQNILSGSKIKCACLGTALNVPLSTVSVIENIGMGVMALVNLL